MASKRSAELRVRLTGDTGEFAAAMKRAADELARTDARFKANANAMSASLAKVGTSAKQTEQEVERSSKSIGEALQNLSSGKLGQAVGRSPLGGLVNELGGAETLLAGVGAKAVVATAGVAALAVAAGKLGQVGVQSFTSVADSVQQFSNLTGKSVEESSGWALALEAVGLGTEQWLDRVRQFQTNLSQYPERAREAGVAVEYMADGTVDATSTMWNAIKRLHGTTDILERQRIGFKLFGESWTQLMPLIRDPAAFEAMRKNFEGALDQDDIDKLNEFETAWGTFQTRIKLAAAEIGSALVPMLTEMLDTIEPALPVVQELAGLMADIATIGFNQVKITLEVVGDVKDFLTSLPVVGDLIKSQAANYQYVRGAVHDLAESTEELTWVQQRNAAGFATYEGAVRAATSATRELATEQAKAATAWLKDATSSITTARKGLADANTALAKASQSLAAAEHAAARSIAQADQRVADARESAAKSIASANRSVQDAHEAQQEAAEDLAKAEEDAAKLVAKANEDAAKRIVDAQRRVEDARERQAKTLRDNNRKMEDAEARLQDAINRALAEDDTVEAQRIRELALRDYERTKEDVAEAERDAARRVQEAEQGLKDAHVEAAERRAEAEERASEMIASAHDRVSEAARRVQDAHNALRDAQVQASRQIAQAEQARADAATNAARQVAAAKQAEMEAAARAYNYEQQLQAARWQQYYAQLDLFKRTWEAQDPNDSLTRVTSRMPGVAKPPPRAGGGRVAEGSPYLIGGSHGIELFVPDSNGTVVPERDLLGGQAIYQFDFSGAVISSERQLTEMLERAMRKAMVGGRR